MSRAFAPSDDLPELPRASYSLPAPGDPRFLEAAAAALLEGARIGDTPAAEEATGVAWGDPVLLLPVRRILAQAKESGDERLEQVAERYLIAAARRPGTP